jgi:3-oxoacyl-[acyl-carrier-protein] synthase III
MPLRSAIPGGGAVTGWGVALPPNLITNSDLASSLGVTAEWIVDRTGIHTRHVGGTCASLAVDAGHAALVRADADPRTVDVLILATTTPERSVPATASEVQQRLGLRCGAIDVNAACSGFVYALTFAYGLLTIGARRVLVIGSDVMSRLTDSTDRDTAILFGDGAGAILLDATSKQSGLLGWNLDSDGAGLDLLLAEQGGFMEMKGREIFRRAVRLMTESAERAMTAAGVKAGDVCMMVPHQANRRIIEALCERMGIPVDRTAITVHTTGNTSSASIPIALAVAVDEGRIERGDLVLFAGFGAGMTAASAVVQW